MYYVVFFNGNSGIYDAIAQHNMGLTDARNPALRFYDRNRDTFVNSRLDNGVSLEDASRFVSEWTPSLGSKNLAIIDDDYNVVESLSKSEEMNITESVSAYDWVSFPRAMDYGLFIINEFDEDNQISIIDARGGHNYYVKLKNSHGQPVSDEVTFELNELDSLKWEDIRDILLECRIATTIR